MEAHDADILVRHPVPRRRLTIAAYHRLGRIGLLGEEKRVELLEGQLVDMSPISSRHAIAVDALVHSLAVAVGDKAYVRGQNPVTLDGASEPQPDIAVVRNTWKGYPDTHPGPEDIFLIVEVSDTSIDTDSGAKLAMYVQSGICEFWIVDLVTNFVRVLRQPSGLSYNSVTLVKPPAQLALEALPGVSIAAPLLV